MRCLSLLIFVSAVSVSQTVLGGEVSPDQIMRYFPGTWEWSREDGSSGNVDWKAVADGKALSGPGFSTRGGTDFGLGGWESHGKKWTGSYSGIQLSGEKTKDTLVLEFDGDSTILLTAKPADGDNVEAVRGTATFNRIR